MTAEEAILNILQWHIGERAAISAENLLANLGVEGFIVAKWELRQMVHDLRIAGHLIASGPGGYWIAASVKEMDICVEQVMRGPSRDMLHTARILRKNAREKYGGQMRFA